MQEMSIYRFIYFGTSLRYLQDAAPNWGVRTAGGIIVNIENFLKRLDEFELFVTRRASSDLTSFLQKLKDDASIKKLNADLVEELKGIVKVLRPTLEAEVGKRVFIVSDKRYPIENLLKDPAALFAKGVFEKLPDIARTDFSEAAQCIAFVRPTAAAFHLLRGTEAVLREFYRSKVKRRRVNLTWGPIVEALRGKRKISGVLLNQLDHIRGSFRNPTAHPEKNYDIDEAQDLLSICIDAVNRMSQETK